MSILLTIALYVVLLIAPLVMYHIAGIGTPFWYWSAGLVSGLTIWYLNMLLGRAKKTVDILTQTLKNTSDEECSTCFYYIDSHCWYKYLRQSDRLQCAYKPKSSERG